MQAVLREKRANQSERTGGVAQRGVRTHLAIRFSGEGAGAPGSGAGAVTVRGKTLKVLRPEAEKNRDAFERIDET